MISGWVPANVSISRKERRTTAKRSHERAYCLETKHAQDDTAIGRCQRYRGGIFRTGLGRSPWRRGGRMAATARGLVQLRPKGRTDAGRRAGSAGQPRCRARPGPARRRPPVPRACPRATSRASGHHPAVGAGIEAIRGHVLQRRADRRRDVLRRLDAVGGDVDRADQHVLAGEEADELDRHVRVRAFERHLVDRRLREQRKRVLVLPPFAAERLLPVVVRLDAVAVADVDGGRAARGPAPRAPARRRPSRGPRRNRR